MLRDNLSGKKFGRLTAVSLHKDRTIDGKARWICSCDCGNTVVARAVCLKNGGTTSCGCARIKDLSGQRFERLLVLGLSKDRCDFSKSYWECICDCGKEVIVCSRNLVSGGTKSCGCLKKELMSGDKNLKWNEALSSLERLAGRRYPKYNEWRTAVYKRDGYFCQKCGEVSGTLNAHHIDAYNSFPEKRIDIDNGITLCEDCHKDFHHIYGFGNNTEAQFSEWINGDES